MKKNNVVWVEVAQTENEMESQVIAGLLRTADIPSYIEIGGGLSALAFGQMIFPGRVYVPEEFYEDAMNLLYEDDDDTLSLDEPGIKFK